MDSSFRRLSNVVTNESTGPASRSSKMFGVPVVMRKFLVLMLAIAFLWFTVIVLWSASDKGLQPYNGRNSTIDKTVVSNIAVREGPRKQSRQKHVFAKSVDRFQSKVLLVSMIKSSKLTKQVQLLLGSARIDFVMVSGGIHDIAVQLIDYVGDLSEDQDMLAIFPSVVMYYAIICRHPDFFKTRFGNYVRVLALVDVDEEYSTRKNLGISSDPSCMPLAVSVDNVTTVNVIHAVNANEDVFRILRAPRGHSPAMLSLYDSSLMRLATLVGFEPSHWRQQLFINSSRGNAALLLLARNVDEEDRTPSKTAIMSINLDYWWSQVVFLDVTGYLIPEHKLMLNRFILVDIDDGFIGLEGTKMTPDDVLALVNEQARIGNIVKNFRFNIGFSASPKFYHTGSAQEKAGDDMLIRQRSNFWWFPHMFDHMQPHMFNDTVELQSRMMKNYKFAVRHNISLVPGYAVSPHHSGVYPVHKTLYDAWRAVYNISVTSTEQYPHLKPLLLHRGFQHRGVSILPRQVCGLYTRTLHLADFPGGLSALNRSIFGGGNSIGIDLDLSLFTTLLTKPVLIFMTHMLNYASGDRVALYTFREALRFITERTNLQFETVEPTKLASLYFDTYYPHDREPVWTNPCTDKRHREIWPRTAVNSSSSSASDKSNIICDNLPLPDVVILGPQKTGTTALYTFLKQHPALISNLDSTTTYEEVQFFSDTARYVTDGLEWYLKQFPANVMKFSSLQSKKNGSAVPDDVRSYLMKPNARVLFEKSATYFDSAKSPVRMHALLPNAKLIVLLADPVKRAYSWYLHMRAHNDAAALQHSFYEVIEPILNRSKKAVDDGDNEKSGAFASDRSNAARLLRNRCIEPGKYSVHLQRWLRLYRPQQLLLLDADELRSDPINIMNKVQNFLQLSPLLDYSKLLRFVASKHFYCPVSESSGRVKCLGGGKGRSATSVPIDRTVDFALRGYYLPYNMQLYGLLQHIGADVPRWLNISVGVESATKASLD